MNPQAILANVREEQDITSVSQSAATGPQPHVAPEAEPSGAYTPSPWFWALDSHNQRTNLMRSGTGDYVASPQADIGDYGLSVDRWTDVSEADATLIEAAPDLLDALQLARARLVAWQGDPPDLLIGVIDAAIYKALGAPTASPEGGPTGSLRTPESPFRDTTRVGGTVADRGKRCGVSGRPPDARCRDSSCPFRPLKPLRRGKTRT